MIPSVQVAGVLISELSGAPLTTVVVGLVEYLGVAGGSLIVEQIHGRVLILEVAALAIRRSARGHIVVHRGQRPRNCAVVHSLRVQSIRHHIDSVSRAIVVMLIGCDGAALPRSRAQWGVVIRPCCTRFLLICGSADKSAEAVVEEVLGARWHHDNGSSSIVVRVHRCLLLLRLEKAAIEPAAVAT